MNRRSTNRGGGILVQATKCGHCLKPFEFGEARKECSTCKRYVVTLFVLKFLFISAFFILNYIYLLLHVLNRSILCLRDWGSGKVCLRSDHQCCRWPFQPPPKEVLQASSSSSTITAAAGNQLRSLLSCMYSLLRVIFDCSSAY